MELLSDQNPNSCVNERTTEPRGVAKGVKIYFKWKIEAFVWGLLRAEATSAQSVRARYPVRAAHETLPIPPRRSPRTDAPRASLVARCKVMLTTDQIICTLFEPPLLSRPP